jgi:transposase
MQIEKYGAGAEKLSQAQLQLFELTPLVSEVIEQAESAHAPVHRSTKKSVKHPGRQELPANLPRVERILPCALDQRVCKRCGKETVVIGYEESSQLDVEPAKYFVLVTKREKRACRACEDLGVVSAPPPPRIIEKCWRVTASSSRRSSANCNHTPLHRQSMILERDLRLDISRATLDGWVLKVGELLIPVVAAMKRELISGSYIQADETPVDVQTRLPAFRRSMTNLGMGPPMSTDASMQMERLQDGMDRNGMAGSRLGQRKMPRIKERGAPWIFDRFKSR